MSQASESSKVSSVLEDPSVQMVAQLYAASLLNVAGSGADAVIDEFQSFVTDVLEAHPDFNRLLTGGFLNRDGRVSLIDRVVAPLATPLFTNFLRVLARHDRLAILPHILQATRLEHEKRNGRQRVQVISARQLDQSAVDRIAAQLRQTFSFEPIIEQQMDPGLIGGLVIRVGNSVYDGSLRSRLNQLAKRMQQRSLHEIQSGRDRFSHPEGD